MNKKLQPKDILALFGAHDLSDYFEAGRMQSPTQIFIHEDFKRFSKIYEADVSLLKFKGDGICLSTFVQPICLWDAKVEPLQ